MSRRDPKIGDRTVWYSCDETLDPIRGSVTKIEGEQFQISWDNGGKSWHRRFSECGVKLERAS